MSSKVYIIKVAFIYLIRKKSKNVLYNIKIIIFTFSSFIISVEVCPPLNSTSVDISCSYKEETVSCSERIRPGTRATLACKSSYKLPLTNDPAYREITCLDDGLWDRRLFRCLPGICHSHISNKRRKSVDKLNILFACRY